MGVIFDTTCEVWQETCNGSGSCWVYDNSSLGIRLVILCVVMKCLSTFFFTLALILYKAPPTGDQPKVTPLDELSKSYTQNKRCLVNCDTDSSIPIRKLAYSGEKNEATDL